MEFLNVDPIDILVAQPGTFIKSINRSPITGSNSGIGNSVGGDLHENNEQQTQMMKLMENVVVLSKKIG